MYAYVKEGVLIVGDMTLNMGVEHAHVSVACFPIASTDNGPSEVFFIGSSILLVNSPSP